MSDYLSGKYMLQRHLQDLKDSLTFDDVRDKLYSKFVLTGDDLSSIDELDSNSLKVSTCLDIILDKNNDEVFRNFIKSLKEIDMETCKDIYNKLTDPSEVQKMKEEKGNQAIVRGRIPRKHKTYITRKEEHHLQQLLTNQKAKEIIVLWGFPLVGKSCLASYVLQNPYLIFDHFKNKVFWLDLRNVTQHDQSLIADHLKRLIGCITEFDNSFDPQREQSLAWYKDMLRLKFLSLCDGGLLVLDNVCSEEVCQYFDIGCKMLIIVNRRECVIKHANNQIELRHFTEDQTAACFAMALSVDVQQLTKIRPIIRNIHQCLEGHPNLVDLVATYLTDQEANQWTDSRWKAMLQRLHREGDKAGTGDSSLQILQKPLNHITNMLLELLTEEQKNYFIQLVIMPEHVNILPEVLIIYWEMSNLYEVEDILDRFHKLSLLERTTIKNENGERKIIYGLRNLFLKRLKSIQNSASRIHCHRKLLKAYKNKYGDPEMLPNDNYIYNYFGHHLLGANIPVEEFCVFLNLKFIGAKIKFCGVGEMLQDFRIYKKYITMNNRMDLTSKLDAYIRFVGKCETNLLRNGMDLVQYALRVTDNHKIVFNDAMDIAKSSLSKLYLRWTFTNEPHFTRTLDVQNSFETVLFTNDPKLILIGTKTGDIQLWDLDSRLMKIKFVGHTKGIKQLKLSPCKKYFVSVSHDMTLKVWKINSKDLCHSPNETAPLSPSLRQRDHHAFFADEASETAVGDSYAFSTTITVTSATFYKHSKEGDNSLNLVSCPSGGKVMQWTFQEENAGFPLKLRGQLLVASNSRKQHTFDLVVSGQFFLFIYSRADKQLYVVNPQLEDGNNYVFIMALPDSNSQEIDIWQILAVNDELCIAIGRDIHIVRFQYELRKENIIYKQHSKYDLKPQGGALSCACLTENATYLVTGTVLGLISLWDLKLMQIVKEFTTNNRVVMGLDTYTTPDSITLLLSGTDDYTVKCWHIDPEHLAQHHDTLNNTTSVHRSASCFISQRLRQRQMFSCYWPANHNSIIRNFYDEREVMNNPSVAVLDEDDNAIQIYNTFQLHTDEVLYNIDVPPSAVNDDNDDGLKKIDVTLFELYSNALYYALCNGVVRRYNLRTGMDTLLRNCTDRQIATLMCLEHNSILVGCDRNSLTLIQCIENRSPNYGVEVIANVLLDPSMSSTSLSHHGDIVHIFHLRHLNVRARIIYLLVVYSSYVHVLCAESSSARAIAADLRRPITGWEGSVHSTYRMKMDQRDARIIDCILSSTESHLVLFLSNGECDILRLEPMVARELSYVSEYIFQVDTKVKITSSAISFDGQLLALGKENGDIEIIDVTKKVTRMILREHKQTIETLLFSPSPNYILVSAAMTICWWKLQETTNISASIASSTSILSSNDNVWNAKQHSTSHNVQFSAISDCSRYLLAQISLPGPLKHVTASKDFTTFITLDSLGIMHSFNVIA